MSKYYAIKKGRKTGIFNTWNECKSYVDGYSGAVYKSFNSKEEADNYLNQIEINKDIEGLIAYVDGSYNIKTKEYGYGCVLIDDGKVVQTLSNKGNNKDYASMRNVAGEILGSLKAIEYALNNNYPGIMIYYDYEGIEKWANGSWKASKEGTKEYVSLINKYSTNIDIGFIKVLAHSGDTYNEMADQLAKKSVGVK
ncbi:MAG: ribonuclease H family protein [Thomasclavelia sp.]|nr:ribonuclease H family protein [Thomasclavelia sp.]